MLVDRWPLVVVVVGVPVSLRCAAHPAGGVDVDVDDDDDTPFVCPFVPPVWPLLRDRAVSAGDRTAG